MRYMKMVVKFALLALLVAASGCAGDPVHPRLPPENPASPQASEGKFVLPPNPFEDRLVSPMTTTEDGTYSDHSTPERSVDRPMDHGADHGSRGTSPGGAQDQTDMRMHGEHSQ